MIPGRCRAGSREVLANALVLLGLLVGTHALGVGMLDFNPSRWTVPWTGDVVLVAAGLLFLGVAFLTPLHGGMINLGIHAEFLVGYSVGALIVRGGIFGPGLQAGLGLVAGAAAGALVGLGITALRQRFAVHEILSGLLAAALFVPLARALSVDRLAPPALGIDLPALTEPLKWAPGLGLAPGTVLAWGILLLALSMVVAVLFAHFLRATVRGFEVRASGANPLAAAAIGTDVEGIQRAMMALGGACAGLTGALQLWTSQAVALERWPFPLGFAGIAVALLGMGSLRGAAVVAFVLAAWLNTPYVAEVLGEPGYGAAATALLLLPALWILPRTLPDFGAPRSIWKTRQREG